MRVFKYVRGALDGKVDCQTMTVADLRKALDAYPEDMPIFCEFDGYQDCLEPENFRNEKVIRGLDIKGVDSLVIAH